MNKREEVKEKILRSESPYILAELPTSFGKSKIALDTMANSCNSNSNILVVVPRVVLKSNWKEEFKKWGYEDFLSQVTFTTYRSFPKMIGHYDFVIFDEVHHLSQRCQDSLEDFTINKAMLLSATVNRDMKYQLNECFPELFIVKVNVKEATKEGVLPDPKVFLIPLSLDNIYENQVIIKNKSKSNSIKVPYNRRWNYKGVKNRQIIITCTQQQYYDDISSMIAWCKKRIFNSTFKNMFLKKSGDRLKWLSEQKTTYIKSLLDLLHKERTLTFCNGIPQTEALGKYCVNSKNRKSATFIEDFNSNKIDHITACNMLDEGINLVNCRIGIYASLNSSERMIKQKLGRLLRHKDPIIIIPYFKHTRDEEIIQEMCKDYNSNLVKVITNLTELKL